jgi:phosphoglucosamine mutase
MSDKLFGTDGVRGVANSELTPYLAMALGVAAAKVLGRSHTPTFVIGRDTRISGPLLEAALSAGLCSQGAVVFSAGVIPTPGVARIARTGHYDAGVVISASHNPYQDNGIKFFGGDGYKLVDGLESEIEALVPRVEELEYPSHANVGTIQSEPELGDYYTSHLIETMEGVDLSNVNVVVDGANGANFDMAPNVLRKLGARVTAINCSPNGTNINSQCGSLHPEEMLARTRAERADAGIAFDGDADRVILSDELGRPVDGDRMMMLVGCHLAEHGKLTNKTIVGTIMSNLGLEIALRERGIMLLRAAVGDRYVSEILRKDSLSLGGEKSGHIIFNDVTTTGDGLLTALQVLKVVQETGRPLSELADQMSEYPQILLSVRVTDRTAWQSDNKVQAAIKAAEEKLTGRGRLNVRASGTEKLIRIMAEGPEQSEIEELGEEIKAVIQKQYGVSA